MYARSDTNQSDLIMGVLSIFRNFAYLTGGRLMGDVVVFLFFVVLARNFGQEGLGQYSFAMALTSIVVVLADFGIFHLSVKDMSRQSDDADIATYYGHLLTLRLMLVGLALGMLLLFLPFLPFSADLKHMVILVGSYQIFLTLVDGFSAVFIARQSMLVSSVLDFSLRVTTALAGIAVALMGGSLLMAATALPVVTVVHVGIAYVLVVRRFGVRPTRLNLERAKVLLRLASPFAQRSLLGLLTLRIAIVCIGFILGEAAAGVFNAAYRVIFVLLFITNFAGLALLPVASQMHASGDGKLRELYSGSLSVTLLVGLPMAGGLWLISKELIDTLYEREFLESAAVLSWLAWLIPIGFLRSISETFLIAMDRQEVVTRSYLIVAVAGVFLHTLFPYFLDVKGAAMAALAAESMLVVILGARLRTLFDWQKVLKRVALSFLGILAFVIAVTVSNVESMTVKILVAASVYALVVSMSSDVRRIEIRSIWGHIQSRYRRGSTD